eukprot:TRINITY_DN1042_c0_g2_i1.p1 TRINITY_DN1042_c0_g2~~TRINITY_DN1042_c0_g2_i1.p1  ORF type:complete len:861 (-),score=208.81 TRINITY_DN1042_c0_g2_i1:58-2640(-)
MWQDTNPDAPNNLTQAEAKTRREFVSPDNIDYNLHLDITKASKEYTGKLILQFDLLKVPTTKGQLFLDFVGQEIESLKVNGEVVTENPFSGNRIELFGLCKEATNKLEIDYKNIYNTDGAGFHRFVDPEDGEVYVYSNFEPFDAHRMFPCFDQPNLKGKFTLTATAPASWKVLSNYPLSKKEETEGSVIHHFATTPKISTYLYALVAGPYDEFNDSFSGDRVPLGIFCRKSLTKFIDTDVLFDQTKRGLQFYEKFFGTAFPFAKYDQIWVPEFNAGAMENVGCVTFWEGYIFKDPPTKAQLANRCDTILHEMAHMWFGNLVTPVWWDGLWLNESFATYMAALCTADATDFGRLSWQNFNSSMKTWAYREDQLSTTHPIQGEVIDTDATFLTFDGITYGKGASLLKQLVYTIGEDAFQEGMRLYFSKYAWGNTTIGDFLGALESVSKGKLSASGWSAEWLETSGLNTLQLQIESEDSRVTKCVVRQSAPEAHPTLRNHYLEVIVYDVVDGNLALRETFPFVVSPSEFSVVDHLVGKPKPAFVFINNNDYAFAKCFLDTDSQNTAVEFLSKFSDSLLRQVLWNSFYDLTRDAIMGVKKFLKLAKQNIIHETDMKLVQTVLDRVSASAQAFVPDANRIQEFDELFKIALEAYQRESASEDQKIVWERAVIGYATSKETVEQVVKLFLGEEDKGVAQNRRWQIIEKAISWNLPEAASLFEKEKERDKSDTGVRASLTCKTSPFDPAVKAAAWERFVAKDTELSGHERDAEMAGFRWFHQRSILEEYKSKFFEVVRDIFQNREKEFAGAFAGNLFPYEPEDDIVLERTKELLASLTPEEQHLRHVLKGTIDDLERARRCRAVADH